MFSKDLILIDNAQQNTNGLGLIHESQSIYDSTAYTRPWFAWANSYFAEWVDLFLPPESTDYDVLITYSRSNPKVNLVQK